MILSLAKWAYQLGVDHERNRIATALQNQQLALFNKQTVIHDRYFDKKVPVDKQLELEVYDRVNEVINSLQVGETIVTNGPSILFPEGDKK